MFSRLQARAHWCFTTVYEKLSSNRFVYFNLLTWSSCFHRFRTLDMAATATQKEQSEPDGFAANPWHLRALHQAGKMPCEDPDLIMVPWLERSIHSIIVMAVAAWCDQRAAEDLCLQFTSKITTNGSIISPFSSPWLIPTHHSWSLGLGWSATWRRTGYFYVHLSIKFSKETAEHRSGVAIWNVFVTSQVMEI